MKKSKGITLIALVITIIIMLILVAVTITYSIKSGLLEKSKDASKKQQTEQEREVFASAVSGAYNAVSGEIKKEDLESELGDGWKVQLGYICTSPNNNEFTVTLDGTTSSDDENDDSKIETVNADNSTNYVGYYADTDGNLENGPEGIIFIDLLRNANNGNVTLSGSCVNCLGSDMTYNYTTNITTKAYIVTTTNFKGETAKFGEYPIISVKKGSTGNDRFLVMALTDYDSNYYTYNEAININYPTGWHLPNVQEWIAFREYLVQKLGLTTSNFGDFGLLNGYFSSDLYSSTYSWGPYFERANIGHHYTPQGMILRISGSF